MIKTAVTCVMTIGLVLGGSAGASAGEYSGKGKPVPGGENGKSLCSYSGRDVVDALEGEGNRPDDALTAQKNYTQNYGLYASLGLKAFLPSPGEACRGNAQEAPH